MSETLEPTYSNSWGLVVGINSYKNSHINNLAFAKNDAEAVHSTLVKKFGFPSENITLLLDEDATCERIKEAFLEFSNLTEKDDRVIVFFAGHGHTKSGTRGEVGYLIPHDGNIDDLHTLVRMEDLTKNTDVIPAKHIFFIMDACYGGLAISRSSAGTDRFLKDMLRRRVCQALTAGKADQIVMDGKGVRPGHSLFTAYLLDGLDGEAAREEGVITANGLMGYVYEKVANDQHSNQTPNFGTLEGDGDFVFNTPASIGEKPDKATLNQEGEKVEVEAGEKDVLISTPFIESDSMEPQGIQESLESILEKEKNAIALERFIFPYIQKYTKSINPERFPNSRDEVSDVEKIKERLQRYEEDINDLCKIAIILAKWSTTEKELEQLERIFTIVAETEKNNSGLSFLINLEWYPLMLLLYSAGISAIANKNYPALKVVLRSKAYVGNGENDLQAIIIPAVSRISEIQDWFKNVSGNEKHYVPRSEYLFKLLQPTLEDLLFLGKRYERYFDEFEVFLALAYILETKREWGPIGRFGYKHGRGKNSPYKNIVEAMKEYGNAWAPSKADIFDYADQEFQQLVSNYTQRLDKLFWF